MIPNGINMRQLSVLPLSSISLLASMSLWLSCGRCPTGQSSP